MLNLSPPSVKRVRKVSCRQVKQGHQRPVPQCVLLTTAFLLECTSKVITSMLTYTLPCLTSLFTRLLVPAPLNAGVPQGSVICSHFFWLYTLGNTIDLLQVGATSVYACICACGYVYTCVHAGLVYVCLHACVHV